MQLQMLSLAYDQWKQMRTFLAVNTYYIKDNKEYRLLLIDFGRGFIATSNISSAVDIVDFEANIKSTAISSISVDAAIAAQIIG